MISFVKAQKIVLSCVARSVRQKVRLDTAANRALAQDVFAAADAPAFDKAVMDGFAVRADDIGNSPVVLKVLAFIPAGKKSSQKISKGQCVQIATGAPLPPGADSVVMKEDAFLIGFGKVKILKKVRRGENVYPQALDYAKGELLLKEGSLLNAGRIGLVASQGKRSVIVFRPPTVALLVTGDEIVEPGFQKRPEQIWNASRSMLSGLLRLMGLDVKYLGIARDEKKIVSAKIKKGLTHDCLILTGAVSVGEKDFVPQILREAGVRIRLHKVAIRPGKPFLFGTHGSRLVFGLPGNPLSSLIGFLLFIQPALRRQMGLKEELIFEEGTLSKSVYNKSGRMSFLPARLKKAAGGKVFVRPLPYSGSADLLAAARADCFFVVGAKQTRAVQGAAVKFLRIKE